jgi:hypothetical protein
MIFLLGTNSSSIKKGTTDGIICPNCNCASTLNYSVYSKYTHITLIPLFPVGKYAVVTCQNCNEIIELEELDETTIAKLASENTNLNNPIWMFFGSFVLLCSITYGCYTYFKTDTKTDFYIQNPTSKDVYYVKDDKGYYYTFRIDSVSNDKIFSTVNEYQVDLPYEIDEINQAQNYLKNTINYSKKEILTLYKNDKIISIKRD